MMTPTLEDLEAAVTREPGNGELRYLLGAQLAQHRDYVRAALELSTALELTPTLYTARLQLGLLRLGMAQPQQAIQTLAPLESLPPDAQYLTLFKRGLVALAQDRFHESLDWLRQGMALNTANLPLNGDMTLLVHEIEQKLAPADAAAPVPETSAVAANAVAPEGKTGEKGKETSDAIRRDFSKYGPGTDAIH
jgi:tetratricopeptide (TPR) repeat protein